MRSPLLKVLAGQDVKARPPTPDELCMLVGRNVRKKTEMLDLLQTWPLSLRDAVSARLPPAWRIGMAPRARAAAPSQGSGSLRSDVAPALQPPLHILQLPSRARLSRGGSRVHDDAVSATSGTGPASGTRSRRPALVHGVTDSQEDG